MTAITVGKFVLINTVYKIHAQIIYQCLPAISEHRFRKNRSNIDGVFIITQILEKHCDFDKKNACSCHRL